MGERRPHPAAARRTAAHPASRQPPGATRAGVRRTTASPAQDRAVRPPRRPQQERRAPGSRRPTPGRSGTPRGGSGRPPVAPRPPLRLPLASSSRRLHALLIVIAVGLSLCGGRLLQLQGFDSSAYAATSADLLTRKLPLLPSRGTITDRNGQVLASTQPAVAVTADPTLTGPRAVEIAEVLSGYLEMPVADLVPLLTQPDTHFVYLKKKVPALTYSALSSALAKMGVYGVFRESDPIRTYPAGTVGSSVVGFVGADGRGLAGMELELDAELAGVEGTESYESAPNGSRIPLGQSSMTPAQNGVDVALTLDAELQFMAEQRLAAQVQKVRADSGFAITIDVKTGQVLVLANAPTFDSSRPAAAAKEDRGNRAVLAPYEPGSVEKILTSAALIDSGTTNPNTKVEIPGRLRSGGASIKDHYSHGTIRLNMRGVIANSSNIGTALLTRQLDKQTLHDYLASFGLGSPTGIEVPGEASGILPDGDMSDSQRDQVAFGQALSVSGIQMAAAIAGIVNDGVYNPPTLVKEKTDASGAVLPNTQQAPRRVISSASSAAVRDLMAAVTDTPNGVKNLRLDAYTGGGKTGTAELANGKCGCYRGYVTSYVGFAPLDDPRLLTYVVLTNPRSGDTGTAVAAPVYRDVMHQALPRYAVAPDADEERTALPTEW